MQQKNFIYIPNYKLTKILGMQLNLVFYYTLYLKYIPDFNLTWLHLYVRKFLFLKTCIYDEYPQHTLNGKGEDL